MNGRAWAATGALAAVAVVWPGRVEASGSETRPYVALGGDLLVGCPGEGGDTTTPGNGGNCFKLTGAATVTIAIADDAFAAVGGTFYFRSASTQVGPTIHFCGTTPDPVEVPTGATSLSVQVQQAQSSTVFGCGPLPPSAGTAGTITVTFT